MKRNTIVFFPGIILLCAFAVNTVDDIVTRLGMRQSEAKKHIFGNMVGDFIYFPNGNNGDAFHGDAFKIPLAKLLPEVIKGDKVSAAKELCAYVKMYCNSEDFINDYNRYRNMFKPKTAPVRDANIVKANANMVSIYKEQITMYEKSLADAKKAKDANSIALYEKSLADLRKQVASLEDPDPEKTAWERKYPVEPSSYIKSRLEEYLSLMATVDFSAKLAAKGGKMIFVNPAYEKKNVKWKAIFRSGKEVNDAVTAFVKEWLKGEIIASLKTKMPVDPDESSAQRKTANPVTETQKSQAVTDSAATKKKPGLSGLKSKINRIIKNN